uniref:Uncharacterized protein n=1 Tax=Strongyloides stercoralis TaxID=6248 RepID=A0AAF5D0Q2_STRER
ISISNQTDMSSTGASFQIYVSSNSFDKVSFTFAEILLYTMNKTEIDVGEIYYNNDGIFKEQLIYAAFNHTSERESKLNRMLEFLMMQPRISSQKVNLYKIRCWFRKSIEVTSRMVQDNKRKDSTQCSILENVFLYLIIDLYFIFFIILSFAYSFSCFIFSFDVKFSVGSVTFCLVVNGFSFSFMNSLLTISGMM